jgi:hypothetical protein
MRSLYHILCFQTYRTLYLTRVILCHRCIFLLVNFNKNCTVKYWNAFISRNDDFPMRLFYLLLHKMTISRSQSVLDADNSESRDGASNDQLLSDNEIDSLASIAEGPADPPSQLPRQFLTPRRADPLI